MELHGIHDKQAGSLPSKRIPPNILDYDCFPGAKQDFGDILNTLEKYCNIVQQTVHTTATSATKEFSSIDKTKQYSSQSVSSFTTLKKIWLEYGFDLIFELCPKAIDPNDFVQELYAAAIHIACGGEDQIVRKTPVQQAAESPTPLTTLNNKTLLRRAGALGILYILHATHPVVTRRLGRGVSNMRRVDVEKCCQEGVPIRISPQAWTVLWELYDELEKHAPLYKDFQVAFLNLCAMPKQHNTRGIRKNKYYSSAFSFASYCGIASLHNIPDVFSKNKSVSTTGVRDLDEGTIEAERNAQQSSYFFPLSFSSRPLSTTHGVRSKGGHPLAVDTEVVDNILQGERLRHQVAEYEKLIRGFNLRDPQTRRENSHILFLNTLLEGSRKHKPLVVDLEPTFGDNVNAESIDQNKAFASQTSGSSNSGTRFNRHSVASTTPIVNHSTRPTDVEVPDQKAIQRKQLEAQTIADRERRHAFYLAQRMKAAKAPVVRSSLLEDSSSEDDSYDDDDDDDESD